MHEDLDALRTTFDAIWLHIAGLKDKIRGERVRVPLFMSPLASDGEAIAESRFSTDFPVLQHTAMALELACRNKAAPIAEHFANVLHLLRWSQNPSYNETNCSRSLLDGYAYAAIAGPDGPIECAAPRGGIMMMGPGVTYPDHRHEPKEVYLVLTPGAQWRLDEGDWFDVEPGDLLYHEAWQMHAIRTTDQPFLAFAGWIEPGERSAIGWGNRPSAVSS